MAFVCIYVYVCLYVHMCVRTLIHGSLNIHTSICVSKCMYVYVLPGDIFNQIWVFFNSNNKPTWQQNTNIHMYVSNWKIHKISSFYVNFIRLCLYIM